MDELELAREVSIEIVWKDENCIELIANVGAGHWRGRATAYTVARDIARFADELTRFTDSGSSATFEAGEDNGIGLIALKFYRVDRSGHIACHARLASGGVSTQHRPEEVSRLAVEFAAETWAIREFAQQLVEMAKSQAGCATFAIEPTV